MKRMKKILAVVLIMCLLLGGCGRQTGASLGESPATTQQEKVTGTEGEAEAGSANEAVNDNKGVNDDSVVYDYQVSQEPIPKEIADLGGPCQGTIHAFPSQIEMGLTRKMIEEDLELKAEVEKRIPEVEQGLEENFGREFQVEIMDIRQKMSWFFLCTELETGYQFVMTYYNFDYAGEDFPMDNKLYLHDYYEKKESEDLQQKFSKMIENSFGDCLNTIWVQSEVDSISIFIIQFTDEEVDKFNEQSKLLSLWKSLRDYSQETKYDIELLYFPTEYQEVIEQKYVNGNFFDYTTGYSTKLLEQGEMVAKFDYTDREKNEEASMDKLYKKYKNWWQPMDQIWPYWIS